MTKYNFYNENDLVLLKKKKSLFILLIVIFAILFAISFTLFMIFADYYNQLIIKISGSIVIGVFSIFIIYFIYRLINVNRLIKQFIFIYSNMGQKYNAKIIDFNSLAYTLADGTKAHEVKISYDKDKIKIVYLVEWIDFTFIKDKQYTLNIVSDYIKEVEYEN